MDPKIQRFVNQLHATTDRMIWGACWDVDTCESCCPKSAWCKPETDDLSTDLYQNEGPLEAFQLISTKTCAFAEQIVIGGSNFLGS